MTRISVSPDMLRWARDRARLDVFALEARFPKLADWETGEAQPTLKQLEDYARVTHAPIGYFFLPEPPVEQIPIPDFRTMANRAVTRPSPNLLDTIYACQERQAWYRDFVLVNGESPLPFVGALNTGIAPVQAAEQIRGRLRFDVDARRDCRTWAEALRLFIEQAERIGAMVMVSGVVLNNNYRHLDPQEFRGFALVDEHAPLVFINGADSKAAQMFTLAHELAHLWLGQSALSDVSAGESSDNAIETWCNQVAAELLVPMNVFVSELMTGEPLDETLSRLARRFKVSTLVILRRLADAGGLDRNAFFNAYRAELERLRNLDAAGSGGGDFYRTTAARRQQAFCAGSGGKHAGRPDFVSRCFPYAGYRQDQHLQRVRALPELLYLMAYLLDANIFIQAKNLQYGFDFCPAFWDWLELNNAAGKILSIQQVGDELQMGGDDLSEWAAAHGDGFFLPPDGLVLPMLPRVSIWAAGQNYEPAAVNTFLQVADYWLVAYALAHGHTVVTHEVPANSTRKIKIPNACIGLGVRFMSPYQMLRHERAKFILGGITE